MIVFLSDKEIAARYSVHRATIWRWAKEGYYPSPVKVSVGVTRWRSSDVEEWERQFNIENGCFKKSLFDDVMNKTTADLLFFDKIAVLKTALKQPGITKKDREHCESLLSEYESFAEKRIDNGRLILDGPWKWETISELGLLCAVFGATMEDIRLHSPSVFDLAMGKKT